MWVREKSLACLFFTHKLFNFPGTKENNVAWIFSESKHKNPGKNVGNYCNNNESNNKLPLRKPSNGIRSLAGSTARTRSTQTTAFWSLSFAATSRVRGDLIEQLHKALRKLVLYLTCQAHERVRTGTANVRPHTTTCD